MNELEALYAQHPPPWRFVGQADTDGSVGVLDANGASVLLCSDTPADRQLGMAIAALPEVLAFCEHLDTRLKRNPAVLVLVDEPNEIRTALDKAGVNHA